MKGFCKDNERLIKWDENSGRIDFHQLIGAKVRVRQISGRTKWKATKQTEFYISDIKFRISVDGKCFAVVYLKGCPGTSFLLADLDILEVKES